MHAQSLQHPRLLLASWFAALCLLAALVAALNLAMRHYAESEREQDHRTWLARASDALDSGQFTAAREAIIMARHLGPGHPDPLIAEGHLHYRLGKWDMAVQAYERAIQNGSRDPGVRQNIVWACIEMKDYARAASQGRKFIEEPWAGPRLARIVAEAYLRMENFRGAIPFFKQAIETEPGDLYLLERLERCYRQTGQPEQAAALRAHIEQLQVETSRAETAPE